MPGKHLHYAPGVVPANQAEPMSFLRDLCQDFRPVLLPLKPGEKRTLRPWDEYLRAHDRLGSSRLDEAMEWLGRGHGVGLLPRNGLWVLDCDTQDAAEAAEEYQVRHARFGPRVETPSGGVHFYYRLPEELRTARLKHHVCRPKHEDGDKSGWDFKLGERTLLVAPGTQRKGAMYRPLTTWFPPPVVDPRELHPGLPLFAETMPFLADPRNHDKRTQAAISYLKRAGKPAIDGEGGRLVLRYITANLTVYFGLDPELACHLLTHPPGGSWNDRCTPPWSRWELWRACEVSVDEVPPLGVARWERVHRVQVIEAKFPAFRRALESASAPGEWCLAADARAEFLRWSRIEPEHCSPKAFGIRVKAAGWGRNQRTRAKLSSIEGVSLPLLRTALADPGKGEASPQNNDPLHLGAGGHEEAC